MDLTPRQKEVASKMVYGRWYTIYDLQTNVKTLQKLMLSKLVERRKIRSIEGHKMRDGVICNAHSYRLRGAG